METIKAELRSDKAKKTPDLYTFKRLTAGEAIKVSSCYYQDKFGRMARVKITSVKTWKKRADVEIHCKFGLYEFFTETYASPDTLTNLYEMIFD